MEDDINIKFEEMTFIPKKTVMNVEKEYSSLYKELQDKCNPDNFLPPNLYDKEKAYIANDICLKLKNAINDDALQKSLRHTAIVELGIHFNSHALRDKLMYHANPSNYKLTEKFGLANELYAEILENGEDVEVLEKIQTIIESELLGKTIYETKQEKQRQWHIEQEKEREKEREKARQLQIEREKARQWQIKQNKITGIIFGVAVIMIILMALIKTNK